jgi:hypothetical protein
MVLRVGRRSGKSLISDVVVLYDALLRDHLRAKLRPAEPRLSIIVCPRLDQATAHLANIWSLLSANPALANLVTSRTADSIALANGSLLLRVR